MEVVVAVVAGQIALVGTLFRWLQKLGNDNKKAISNVYTKDETKEAIELRMKPLQVSIEHLHNDVHELKDMVGRLLNANNKK